MEREDYNEASYEFSKRRRMRRKLDRLLQAYSLMGLLMAIFAGGYLVLTLLPFELSFKQQYALMLAGIGIALALMSRTLMVFRRERESEEVERLREYESLSLFLDTWARFERTSKEMLSREGEEVNIHSLRSVISRLYEEGKIDKNDVTTLEEALQTRNLIVHGERLLSTKVSDKITDSLVEIIKKIAMPLKL